MNATQDTFSTLVIERLRSKADGWKLSGIEAGTDDDLIAEALTGTKTDSLRTPRLVIRKDDAMLKIAVRNVTRLGAGGTVSNSAVCANLTSLFFPGLQEDGEKVATQIALLQLIAQQFITTPRSADDLLAAVIEGSNDGTVRTRAVKDPRDGEIYVDTTTPCDGKEIPAGFDDAVDAVLHHAALIGRFLRISRDMILPDQSAATKQLADVIRLMMESRQSEPKHESAERAEEHLTL